MGRLTQKQRVFIEEYLHCWNASEAARRAGYRGRANTIGPRLLANVGIKAEVERRIAERAMSADEVLDRLGQQARGDIGDFIDVVEGASGMFVPNIARAKRERRTHLIKRLRYSPERGVEIELYDAQAALAHIARALGLFVDRVEHSGPKAGPIPHDLSKLPPALIRAVTDALAKEGDGSSVD